MVEELRNRARDVLLTQAIVQEELHTSAKEPTQELLEMDGMDDETAKKLAAIGVVTMDDLAELSIDDFDDIEGVDEARAGELIMTARAPWFAEEQQ
jgi:N utilization substance protein A